VSVSSSLSIENLQVSPSPTSGRISNAVVVESTPQKEEESSEDEVMKVSSVTGSVTSGKDIQYEMATARLKREIEEGLKRERELYQEGRLKSIRSDEVIFFSIITILPKDACF
jgi:hypothetical protein